MLESRSNRLGWVVPWGGSLVLHVVLGALVAATAPGARVVEEVTAGSWAGSVFEVGLSSVDGTEGERAVESGRESAGAAPLDGARMALDPEALDPEEGGPSQAVPAAAPPPNSEPARVPAEEPPQPSDDARRQTAMLEAARGQTRGHRAGPPDEARRETMGEPGAPASEAEGKPGGGAEAVGLGGNRAPARVGQLPAAWTRALPAAARGDTTWHELEPGLVGRWLVLAKLDEAGALASLRVESGSRPYVDRLLRVSQALLRAGRFALPAGSSGEHRLGLEVWIDRSGEASPEGEPHLVRQLASRYPTAEEPGEAIVVFNSGRRVQLRVFLDPRW